MAPVASCLAQAPAERRRHEHEQKQNEERTRRTVRQERERRHPREIDGAQPQRQVLPLVERVPERGGDGDAFAGVQRQEREHQLRIGLRTDTAEPATYQTSGRQQRAGNREEPLDAMTFTRGARLREAGGQRGGPHFYLPRRQARKSIQGMTWGPSGNV